VVHSFSGDDPIACRDYVREKLGLPPFTPAKKANGSTGGKAGGKAGGKGSAAFAGWTFVAEWIYRNAASAPYLKVRRFLDGESKKQYPQYHWDGSQWAKGAPSGPKIPYRLPQLLAAAPTAVIFFVEGEKCADALAEVGGSWPPPRAKAQGRNGLPNSQIISAIARW
jgi:hypothetical protein